MRVIVSSLIQCFKDTDQQIPFFSPNDPTFATVVADSYTKYNSSGFTLAPSGTFAIPLGNVTAPRGIYLRIEGAAGANVTINGGTPRQVRPISDASSAALSTPVSYWLETTNDLVSITVAHPSSSGDPITGVYLIIGDPV